MATRKTAAARRRDAKAKWARENRRSRAKPKEPKTCERCGVEFLPARSDAKFCSGLCRKRSHDQRHYVSADERHRQAAIDAKERDKRWEKSAAEFAATLRDES